RAALRRGGGAAVPPSAVAAFQRGGRPARRTGKADRRDRRLVSRAQDPAAVRSRAGRPHRRGGPRTGTTRVRRDRYRDGALWRSTHASRSSVRPRYRGGGFTGTDGG